MSYAWGSQNYYKSLYTNITKSPLLTIPLDMLRRNRPCVKNLCIYIMIQLFNTLKHSVCRKMRIEPSHAENAFSPISP